MTAPKVPFAGLAQAWEWLPVDRDAAFKLAFEWYGQNLPALLYGAPLDAERQKWYDRAGKARAIGDNTSFAEERLTCWETAAKIYEGKVWPAKGLPSYEAAARATEPGRRVAAVKAVIDALNGAFAPAVRFRMTFGGERELSAGEVLVPQADVEAMVPMTPLKAVLSEAATAAKAASVVTVDGVASMDGALFMSTLPALLAHVADWAAANSGLARKPFGRAVIPAKAAPAQPTGPRARRAPVSNKSNVNDRMVITVLDPAGLRAHGRRGKMADAMDAIRDGITMGQFRAAVVGANPKNGNWYVLEAVKIARDGGFIAVQ